MLSPKMPGFVLGFFIFSFLLIVSHSEIAAQCGGTYFKRNSTTHLPISAAFSTVADITGDGVPDLIGADTNMPADNNHKLLILPGNGSGGFSAPITVNLGAPRRIMLFVIGDFDNDNLKDIYLRFWSPGGHQVYRNNGDGTFTSYPTFDGPATLNIIMTDINDDGKGDLVSTAIDDLRYHLGNGDGTFQPPVTFANIDRRYAALSGDFNGDGKPDFTNGTRVIINQGNLVFSTVPNALALGANELQMNVADYTGDGKSDVLALARGENGGLLLFVSTGSNSFQRRDFPLVIDGNSYNTTTNGTLHYGNFSGNASPDVIFTAPDINKTIVFTNNGTGIFSPQTFNYKFEGLTGDFDSDGKTDSVILSGPNITHAQPHKLFNEASINVRKNVCNRVGQPRLVDFDHSGTTDFSYWTPANGKWTYISNPAQPTRSVSVNWGAGAAGDIPTPGDFDGDGATDYAVYRNSTGVWWIFRSSDAQAQGLQFGLPGDKPVVGDYDGDSVSDLAVWRPSTGDWHIFLMGTGQYFGNRWGQNGDKPVPEDYDGDGKTDLAVFRPSTGAWYYLKSSDFGFVWIQFGLGSDKLVPADYDGDGKADIAVYRESTTALHVLRSYNYDVASFSFGIAGDIFQPGDYNGDYVADVAAYRPSTQRWYLRSQTAPIAFGAVDVLPTASMLKVE